MKIAVYGKEFNTHFNETVSFLFNLLEVNDIEITVHDSFYNFLDKQLDTTPRVQSTFQSHEEIDSNIDFFFSIGGDGTFLETISYVRDKGIPIVGINTGRLGFLAYVSKDEIPELVQAILNKQYTLEERALLKLNTESNLFGDFNYALNEATILKTDTSSMIKIHVFMEGEFLNSYWADGLVIATPTGSTAYSLSAGGPIVVPNSKNFIITPLAPHNLNVRPLVVPDDKEISLKVEGRNDTFLASLDYRSETFGQDLELNIRKADFSVSVLKLQQHNFFGTLRGKLMWGADTRN